MSKKFKNVLEAAVRGAGRAALAATMMWGYRQSLERLVQSCRRLKRLLQSCHQRRALALKILLALFLAGVVLVEVHHSTVFTAGDSVIAIQAMLGLSSPSKFLYRTSEAKAAIGCGTTRLYSLINSGVLEARRYGHRTYITGASLEAFVASLPRVVTPTMMKAGHQGLGRRPPAATPEDGAEHNRRSGRGNPRSDLEEDAAE